MWEDDLNAGVRPVLTETENRIQVGFSVRNRNNLSLGVNDR